jgi:cysteine desulfurase
VIEALRPDTALVSVMHANNETGALQPVIAIGSACRERGITFHVDAVQSLGRVIVDCHAMGADLVTLSAHKVGGPKGCGVLVVRDGLKLQPVLTGGAQESGLRAGTENVAAIVGGARAIADAVSDGPRRHAVLEALTEELERSVLAVPGAELNGPRDLRVPGIVNVSFEGIEGTAVVHALDLCGFSVSTGSACTAGSTSPSHVLEAMDLPGWRVRGAVRFSLGAQNTRAEIEALAAALPEVLARVRAHAVSS